MKEVAQAIRRADGDSTYCEIHSDYGHDAFLLEHEQQQPLVKAFLDRSMNEMRANR
jgi:homoserine O-acetyltransferase